MDSVLQSNRITRWKKKHTIHQNCRTPLLAFSAFLLCTAIFIFFHSRTPLFRNSQPVLHTFCAGTTAFRETILWYAPHSGFSNQLSEFKNAVLMAAILNRTLIIPPVLDHHAVALGSCPKLRVLTPSELRFQVWNHSIQLIRELRYLSMADIIDLSSLTSISAVRFIDFRVFISMWCGVNLDLACSKDASEYPSVREKLKQCGSFLSGYEGNINKCLYASSEDCRSTVWTYQSKDADGTLDSFQADEELRKKKKIPFPRKRKDVYKFFGPQSAAGESDILAFGSLFTAPYKGSELHIDIHEAPKDQRIQFLMQKIEFLPFVSEILNAGKKFVVETIKAPFLCAQLRLLDGQFKNHWKTTFLEMKHKMNSLIRKGPLPVHVFVMTDLPQSNWTGSYLEDLRKDEDASKLFFLKEEDELVVETAKKLARAGHGMKFQFGTSDFAWRKQRCNSVSKPDILLYIEETICSCASLGFIGTSGSTIAESIELMRKNNMCEV